jgi:hypothetical protein
MLRPWILSGSLFLTLASAPAHATLLFSDDTPGSTTYTVPSTGEYRINATGAAFGIILFYSEIEFSPGGPGSSVGGTFNLIAGDILNVDVGAEQSYTNEDSSVFLGGTPLIIASGFEDDSSINTGFDQTFAVGPYNCCQYLVFENPFPDDPNSEGFYYVAGPDEPNGLVQISAVPEPSGWATMLTGLALTGYLLRRRARTSVVYG